MALQRSRLRSAILSLALAACRDGVTTPRSASHQSGESPPPLPHGIMAITISKIGTPAMSASAVAPEVTYGAGASSLSLAVPQNSNATGDGTVQLQALATGSFTSGTRGAGGYRYVWATFSIRNAQSDGSAYDTPRANLTFFAVSSAGTIGGSAIASMSKFDGTPASASIATQILPTGNVYQLNGQLAVNQPDVLQLITDAEADALTVSGATVLPYGFITRNATDGSRALNASPAVGQFDGVVTFSFKIPLQASATDDPFTVTARFQAVDDSQTRLTQSLEDQLDVTTRLVSRAGQVSATLVTLLPGGAYSGSQTTRVLCNVRTAGTSAAPTAYLVHTC